MNMRIRGGVAVLGVFLAFALGADQAKYRRSSVDQLRKDDYVCVVRNDGSRVFGFIERTAGKDQKEPFIVITRGEATSIVLVGDIGEVLVRVQPPPREVPADTSEPSPGTTTSDTAPVRPPRAETAGGWTNGRSMPVDPPDVSPFFASRLVPWARDFNVMLSGLQIRPVGDGMAKGALGRIGQASPEMFKIIGGQEKYSRNVKSRELWMLYSLENLLLRARLGRFFEAAFVNGELFAKNRKMAAGIRIDGRDDDWKLVPVGFGDPENDGIVEYDFFSNIRVGADGPPPGADIVEMSAITTDDALFVKLRMKARAFEGIGSPGYVLQVMGSKFDPDEHVLLTHRSGELAGLYLVGANGVTRRLTFEEPVVGEVVEVRLDLKGLPELPDLFAVRAATFGASGDKIVYLDDAYALVAGKHPIEPDDLMNGIAVRRFGALGVPARSGDYYSAVQLLIGYSIIHQKHLLVKGVDPFKDVSESRMLDKFTRHDYGRMTFWVDKRVSSYTSDMAVRKFCDRANGLCEEMFELTGWTPAAHPGGRIDLVIVPNYVGKHAVEGLCPPPPYRFAVTFVAHSADLVSRDTLNDGFLATIVHEICHMVSPAPSERRLWFEEGIVTYLSWELVLAQKDGAYTRDFIDAKYAQAFERYRNDGFMISSFYTGNKPVPIQDRLAAGYYAVAFMFREYEKKFGRPALEKFLRSLNDPANFASWEAKAVDNTIVGLASRAAGRDIFKTFRDWGFRDLDHDAVKAVFAGGGN